MPTDLPASTQPAPMRRLSWPQTVLFLSLIARMQVLDLRLAAIYRIAERRGHAPHGPTLFRLVRRWLIIHERIGTMLPGIQEPPRVRQVRAVLTALGRGDQQNQGRKA